MPEDPNFVAVQLVRLFDVNRMTGHPDRNLAESALYSLSELMEEIPVLFCVLDVHEKSHQLIPINLPGVLPLPFYPLSFRRNRAKPATKFGQRLSDHAIRDRAAIVKPQWQQNLESPAGNAHRSLVL